MRIRSMLGFSGDGCFGTIVSSGRAGEIALATGDETIVPKQPSPLKPSIDRILIFL